MKAGEWLKRELPGNPADHLATVFDGAGRLFDLMDHSNEPR